jgi:hypothetical protein
LPNVAIAMSTGGFDPSARSLALLNLTEGLGLLRAFDPITLRELWNNQSDRFAGDPNNKRYRFAKFVSPMIANGRVYLATGSNRVLAYGPH